MNKQNWFQPWEEVYQLHLDLEYRNFGGPESKGDLFELLHYIFQYSCSTITDILSWIIHKRKCSVAVPNRRFVNFERKLHFCLSFSKAHSQWHTSVKQKWCPTLLVWAQIDPDAIILLQRYCLLLLSYIFLALIKLLLHLKVILTRGCVASTLGQNLDDGR